MKENERIGWIDSARAVAMFCIVLGHTLRGESIYYELYAFHVPLCILISGFCFQKKDDLKTFFTKLFKREYIPYLAFSLISIAIYVLMGPLAEGKSVLRELPLYLYGMLYGNGSLGIPETAGYMRWNLPLWYIPCMIAVEVIAWMVFHRILRERTDNKLDLLGAFFLSVVIACVLYRWVRPENFPFGIETALYLFPFFLLGRLMRVIYEEKQRTNYWTKKGKIVLGACGGGCMVIGLMFSHLNGNVDYVCDGYGTSYLAFLFFAVLISLGLCLLLYSASSRIHRGLSYLGQNTLPVLMMHKFPIMFYVIIISPHLWENGSEFSLLIGTAVALIATVSCLLVGRIAEKILPEILGKTRVKRDLILPSK